MNAASLDLCKELHELSEWETGSTGLNYYDNQIVFGTVAGCTPAYDLGFLVERITRVSSIKIRQDKGKYIATAPNHYHFEGPTPEDVACKFAIELLKLRNLE